MKRTFSLFVIFIFFCEMFSLSLNAQVVQPQNGYVFTDSSYGRAVKKFEVLYGEQEEQLGRSQIIIDSEVLAPNSFCVDEEGYFYVLDTLNSKIKKYSQEGVYLSSISLPSDIYGLDFEIMDDYLYVYDDNSCLYAVEESNPRNYYLIAEINREDIAGLYRRNNELYIRSYNGSDLKITLPKGISNGMKSRSWDISTDDTIIGLGNVESNDFEQMKTLSSKDELTYYLPCVVVPLGAYCIRDDGDILYLLSNETDWNYAETRITKVKDGEVYKSALTISGKKYNYGIPFKKIYIHDDIVYQMVPEEKALAFYAIPWTSNTESRISNEMVNQFALVHNESKAVNVANVSVTREEAIERAYNMCYTGWTYNASTMHTPTTSNTASPEHLGTQSKNVAGIPYCWGGMNGLDTATYSGSSASYMQNFSDCLNTNKTAGNIACVGSTWVSGTFGVDCSGFVCSVFKIPNKIGTADLVQYFTESSWASAVEGDVAISPNDHTLMVKHVYSNATSGIYMISTYESTVDGSSDCAKVYHRDFSDVCNRFGLYTY